MLSFFSLLQAIENNQDLCEVVLPGLRKLYTTHLEKN